MLSAALGRPISYQPISLLQYRRELKAQRLPGAFVNVQMLINAIARLGLAAKVNDTIKRLLGRDGGTMEAYISAHTGLWSPEQPDRH